MSQENIEIVERAIAAYSRMGEAPDEYLFDPEMEVWESPELPAEFAGKGYDNLVRARERALDSAPPPARRAPRRPRRVSRPGQIAGTTADG